MPARSFRAPDRSLEAVLESLQRLGHALDDASQRLEGRPAPPPAEAPAPPRRRVEFEDLTPVRSVHRAPPR